MAGLLDRFLNTPGQGPALGLLGANLIAAGAPSTDPGASARGLATAMGQYVQTLRQAKQDQMEEQAFRLKLGEAEAQQAARQKWREALSSPGLLGGLQQTGMDPGLMRGILAGMGPAAGGKLYMDLMKPQKPTKPEIVYQPTGDGMEQGYIWQDGRLQSWGEPRPRFQKDRTLVEVADPNSPTGTRYVPRTEAVGRPGRPDRGMRLTTTPEGGIELVQGRGVTGNGPTIERSTKGKLEMGEFDSGAIETRLQNIEQAFDPRYLELPFQASMGIKAFGERMGATLSPEDKQTLSAYSNFASDTLNNLNRTLNELSGAAVTEHELKRLKQELPNLDDSPTVFQAKLEASTQRIQRVIQRYRLAQSKGVDPKTLPLQEDEAGTRQQAPEVGTVVTDPTDNARYRYNGGPPDQQSSWELVQ